MHALFLHLEKEASILFQAFENGIYLTYHILFVCKCNFVADSCMYDVTGAPVIHHDWDHTMSQRLEDHPTSEFSNGRKQ